MSVQIADEFKEKKHKVIVKVGMLGDSGIGKTSLMVKYIEDKYDEDYIETLGVNFMEKKVGLNNVDVTISIWDLGGQREFATLMPLVCSDAKELEDIHKTDITRQARKFAKKMHAPLIYCSSAQSINVKKIFKVIIAKVFDLKPRIKEAHDATKEALIEFEAANGGDADDDGDKKEEKKKDKKDRKKKKKKKKKDKDRKKKRKSKKKKKHKSDTDTDAEDTEAEKTDAEASEDDSKDDE